MRMLISLEENNMYFSKLSNHFGTCNFFGIYDSDLKKLEIIPNFIDHKNNKSPIEQTLEKNIDFVFSKGMGKKAIELFNEKKISLKTGEYKILMEVIDNLSCLKDLSLPCKH